MTGERTSSSGSGTARIRPKEKFPADCRAVAADAKAPSTLDSTFRLPRPQRVPQRINAEVGEAHSPLRVGHLEELDRWDRARNNEQRIDSTERAKA